MQDIRYISINEFERAIVAFSFSQLKGVIEEIAKHCQGNVDMETLKDLQRKETKVWKELQRRNYIGKPKQNDEMHKWRGSLKYNKKVW